MTRDHLITFTCNVCEDTACECSTTEDVRPTRCPMQWIPCWRREGE